MRLFLAIYPPKEYLDYCRDVLRKLEKEKRNIRPIKPELVHLTLRYVGPQVVEASAEAIAIGLKARAGQYTKPTYYTEDLSLGVMGQHDPRVLMTNIDETADHRTLVNEVHGVIKEFQFEDVINWKEQDDVGPHISFARVKPNVGPRVARDLRKVVKALEVELPAPFQAEEMFLVRSDMGIDGPVYTKIERIKL